MSIKHRLFHETTKQKLVYITVAAFCIAATEKSLIAFFENSKNARASLWQARIRAAIRAG